MKRLLVVCLTFLSAGCAGSLRFDPTPGQLSRAQDAAKPAPAAVAAAPAPAPAPAPVAAPAPAPEPTAAPTLSPAAGTYPSAQQVTIDGPAGAAIHYTTDGSAPTAASPVYTGPIPVSSTTQVQAIAVAPEHPASAVASGTYEIKPPPPPAAPARVQVTKEKIELKEKVFFATSKAAIQPASFGLLDEVAGVMKDHPEIKKVLVEGHTDNTGDASFNKKLSQERAAAVRKYLVEKGVDAARLDAKGFGDTRPIAPNTDAKGRDANRRVELTIEQQGT